MEKLKTLKDLQKEYEWKFDTYMALRQEAIKWIKDIEEKEKMLGDDSTDVFYEEVKREKVNWIKHFFNITEEDLK